MWQHPVPIHGLYIHIPFCTHLCGYCDFIKHPPGSDWDSYPQAILNEFLFLRSRLPLLQRPTTLYFGGGTPSLFEGKLISRIVEALCPYIDLSGLKEFTVEANPTDITPPLLHHWASSGVTRLSIGIQSLFAGLILNLGRHQQLSEVQRALALLHHFSFSTNLDLIFACPGMNTLHLESTLSKLLATPLTHLSTYELTLYPSHPSYTFRPSEDEVVLQANIIRDVLTTQGFEHYEVSNYARPGHASCHNLHYWNTQNILGLGVGAHSSFYLNHPQSSHWSHLQWTNPGSLSPYVTQNTPDTHPCFQASYESPSETEKLFLIAQLRKAEGFSLQAYTQLFHRSFTHAYASVLPPLISQGWLQLQQGRCRPTAEGLWFLDSILNTLFEALDRRLDSHPGHSHKRL